MLSRKVIFYAILHFLTDFCCAFFMFHLADNVADIYGYFLLYNFCAFALQMPIGLLADYWNRNSVVAALGCFLTVTAAVIGKPGVQEGALPPMLSLVTVFLAGIGNCLFHVGGGIEVLSGEKEALFPLGVFVSPGAIGIYLGTYLGKGAQLSYALPYVLLFLGSFILLLRRRQSGELISKNTPLIKGTISQRRWVIISLVCFFLVVVLRSHLGMVFSFPWKKTGAGSVLALSAVVLGKASGGFLSDQIGLKKAMLFATAGAGICFFFSQQMFWGVLGLFLFNMTMPMTLYLAAQMLQGLKGFAFGILTFAIFIGFLPAYFGYGRCEPALLAGYALLSGVFLLAGWYVKSFLVENQRK